ncbi:hypothetical protein PQ744_12395 [Thermoanaerobacterium thermosaccharolyticum]|uniref:hypothetical protein n=1 Tax=Thermoanaerobacterium thermosaccharolyticum TaxID=1517 RepID=UPI003D2E952D
MKRRTEKETETIRLGSTAEDLFIELFLEVFGPEKTNKAKFILIIICQKSYDVIIKLEL